MVNQERPHSGPMLLPGRAVTPSSWSQFLHLYGEHTGVLFCWECRVLCVQRQSCESMSSEVDSLFLTGSPVRLGLPHLATSVTWRSPGNDTEAPGVVPK
jgi:hypothetical protein